MSARLSSVLFAIACEIGPLRMAFDFDVEGTFLYTRAVAACALRRR